MGCDIHVCLEILIDNKWVMTANLPHGVRLKERDYNVFAALANVRNYNKIPFLEPRGFPEDAADSTKYLYEQWGNDAHTPSFLSVEAAMTCLLTHGYFVPNTERKVVALEQAADYFLDLDLDPGDDIAEYRIVFWFDN